MACAAAVLQAGLQEALDPWQIAKARFFDSLDEDEKTLFNEATIENLYYRSSNIDREDQNGSKARTALNSLQPLISAVQDYGKALDAYANVAPLFLAPIWGSIRVILIMASSYGRFYSRIADTFGRIGDILPRYRDYQKIFDGQKHQAFAQALSIAYLDIIILCTEFKSLLLNQKNSSVKRLLQPLSSSLNRRLEEAVARFRKHRKEVDKQAEVCHMIEEKEARDLVLRNHAAAAARERYAKQKKLVSQLSNIDYRNKHRRMQRVRCAGTGTWFTASSEFKEWLDCSSSSVLCCYGIPGCGKSVLTSSLIDYLSSDIINIDTKRKIAFFYCDYADKRTLDPVNIFRSLAQQLLRSAGELPTAIAAVLEGLSEDEMADSDDLCILFLVIIKEISPVAIFIDGLDEASEDNRKLVFLKLKDIMSEATSSHVKLFVSSREDTAYLIRPWNIPNSKVHVGGQAVDTDIDGYVRYAVREAIRMGDLVLGDISLEEEISTALAGGAKGMFLWACFQLDELCAAETDNAIRKVLKNLPRDLGETYDRLLGRVEGFERQEYVRRMFKWIMFARRPLHINELREAIAFTIDDSHWDNTKIPNDIQRLIRACGNLILVDEETENVHLAHYTVQQYLLDLKSSKPSKFHVTPEEANYEIGEVCVAYLSFSDFETQIIRHKDTTTPSFAALEKAVGTQSLIPHDSLGGSAAKVLTIFRGRKYSPTNIEYNRQVIDMNPAKVPLTKKYSLLSYITETWLWHTAGFTDAAHDARGRSAAQDLFRNLILDKKLLFDFRPWDDIPIPKDLPFGFQVGWALSANHLPVLQAVLHREPAGMIQEYIRHASQCFHGIVSPITHISKEKQSKLKDIPMSAVPDLGLVAHNCAHWLYCQLYRASKEENFSIIEICFADSLHIHACRAALSHLILEASSHDQSSFMTKLFELYGQAKNDIIWTTVDHDGLACNAKERAALLGFHDTMDFLEEWGCPTSDSFRNSGIVASKLQDAATVGKLGIVKCLLLLLAVDLDPAWTCVQGNTTSQKSDLGSGMPPSYDGGVTESSVQNTAMGFPTIKMEIKRGKSGLHEETSPGKPWEPWAGEFQRYQNKLRAIMAAARGGREETIHELLKIPISLVENDSTSIADFQCALITAHFTDQHELVQSLLARSNGMKAAVSHLSHKYLDEIKFQLSRLYGLDSSVPVGQSLIAHSVRVLQRPSREFMRSDYHHSDRVLHAIIDSLLDASVVLGFEDGRWLLLEAMAENRPQRIQKLFRTHLDILLEVVLPVTTPLLLPIISNLHPRVETGASFIQQAAIKAGVDPTSFFFLPPLIWAMIFARYEAVKDLILAGASIEEREPESGYTPLQIAVKIGSLELVKLLIENGADIRAMDTRGRYLLQVARESNWHDQWYQIMDYLIYHDYVFWKETMKKTVDEFDMDSHLPVMSP